MSSPTDSYAGPAADRDALLRTARLVGPMHGRNEWVHQHGPGEACRPGCLVVHPDLSETPVLL